MVSMSKPSTDRIEKTKEMRMTVSTLKLPWLTGQPQKIPATILQDKKDLSSNEVGEAQNIMNISKERDMDNIKQKRSHNLLPAYSLFDSDIHALTNALNLLPIVIQPMYLEVWDVV